MTTGGLVGSSARRVNERTAGFSRAFIHSFIHSLHPNPQSPIPNPQSPISLPPTSPCARVDGSRGEFDMRVLLNGYVAGYAYARGALDTSRPFAELRSASLVSAAAIAAGDAPDFSSRIRAQLPPAP